MVTIAPHSGCTDCCNNSSHNPVLSLLLDSKVVYIEAQPLVWKFVTIDLTACTSSGKWLLADKDWKRATKVMQSGLKLRVDSLGTLLDLEYGLPPITTFSKFAVRKLKVLYGAVGNSDVNRRRVAQLLAAGVQEVTVGFRRKFEVRTPGTQVSILEPADHQHSQSHGY